MGVFVAIAPLHQQNSVQAPDKVLAKREQEGRFLGFCEGDYRYALLQPKTGKTVGFFMANKSPGIDWYLAMHQGESVRVKYDRVETFILEAGQREAIDRISDAVASKTSYAEWAKNAPSVEESARLEKLAMSMTKDCGPASRAPEMGTWRLSYGKTIGGDLKVILGKADAEFELDVWGGPPTYNSGFAAGRMVLKDGQWSWESNELGPCRLIFTFEQRSVRIVQVGEPGPCGFGNGVRADGEYRLISHDKPKFRGKR